MFCMFFFVALCSMLSIISHINIKHLLLYMFCILLIQINLLHISLFLVMHLFKNSPF